MARTLLDVPHLPHQITGRAPGETRNRPEAFQVGPMADAAGRRLSAATCGHERRPLLDAALWDVGDEARTGVPQFEALAVFRHLDDPVADRLGPAVGNREEHI